MSADGHLKITPISHPALASHKKREERTCALCELALWGHHPILLKSGQSVHVDCYFRMQKTPRRNRKN